MSEPEKTAELPAAPQHSELSEAEKRANAERTNAFMDMAQLTDKVVEASGGNIDALMLLKSFKQLQVAVDALAELLLAAPLVQVIQAPEASSDANPDQPKQLKLGPHPFNRETFWRLCAKKAESSNSLVRRAILSQGAQVGAGAGLKQ
jgi:hypothetical protein